MRDARGIALLIVVGLLLACGGAESAGADGLGPDADAWAQDLPDEPDAPDTPGEGGEGLDAPDLPCGAQITFDAQAYAAAPFGPLEIVVAVDGAAAVDLRHRRAVDGEPMATLSMTPDALPAGATTWRATIPAQGQTPAGLDLQILVRAEACDRWYPEPDAAYEAPGKVHHVALFGELALAVDPARYLYVPGVSGDHVAWAREEKGGQADDVWVADMPTLTATPITFLERPQGPADISGTLVAWADRRHAEDAYDPNSEIYLMDLSTGDEHRLTDDPEGQYHVAIAGHIVAWRDDRNMAASGTLNGDIYLYDLGPDKRFGSADDGGEIQLTADPHDQTAPDVWVGPDGRVRIVWYDFRDDVDGVCDATCDWNVYLYDFGPDGQHGTADDSGEVRLTLDPTEQTSPAIWGTRVAWLDAREGWWMDPNIWVLDLGPDGVFGTADDEAAHRLPLDVSEPDHLDLDGDRLVFEDFRMGSWEIWLVDLATGTETQITDNPRGQFYPRISGDVIVWQDARNNDPDGEPFDDIYAYILPPPGVIP